MKSPVLIPLAMLCLLAGAERIEAASNSINEEVAIRQIDELPNLPSKLEIRDWKKVAREYVMLVSDESASGTHLPLIRWEPSGPNFAGSGSPHIPSFVGITRGGDALNIFGTVIGGTLAGVDMTHLRGRDWVLPMKQFYAVSAGRHVIGNNQRQARSTGLWYDVVPGIYFFQTVDRYRHIADQNTPFRRGKGQASLRTVMEQTATEWYRTLDFLGGSERGWADFWGVVGFDTVAMEIDDRDGNHPGVPECAAGIGWLQYMAYREFQDEKFLQGTEWALEFLQRGERSPLHNGVQLSYGALAMARMNAELQRDYDVAKVIRWAFGEGQPLRRGWGVLKGSWGGFEVSGLIGSEPTRDGSGRAYALQGFHMVAALAPLVRYDPRFARPVGKWMLHKASSSRHYYQTYLPEGSRDSPFWGGDPKGVVPFESLRGNHSRSYFEDYAKRLKAAEGSNRVVLARVERAAAKPPALWASGRTGAVLGGLGLCPYFGGAVGYLGAVASPTNTEGILQLDLLATDFFRADAYPTFLYYNPHRSAKSVALEVGPVPVDLYDAVTHEFIAREVIGPYNLMIEADKARVVIVAPAKGEAKREGNQLRVNGVTVDFRLPAEPLL
jgi:hypothetical protein